MRATSSFGVPRGAISPNHATTSKPGTSFAITGASGNVADVVSEVTPTIRTRPERTAACTELTAAIASGMCPPIVSVMSGAAPLYGTIAIFVFASMLNRCTGSTEPAVPMSS
jgi:hypothetical protein